MQVLWEKLVQIGTASGYSVTALGLRLYMQQGMLVREGGSMSRVAEHSGLERTHLYRKLKALGLQVGRREES